MMAQPPEQLIYLLGINHRHGCFIAYFGMCVFIYIYLSIHKYLYLATYEGEKRSFLKGSERHLSASSLKRFSFFTKKKVLQISYTTVNPTYTLDLKTWFSLVPAKHKVKNEEKNTT